MSNWAYKLLPQDTSCQLSNDQLDRQHLLLCRENSDSKEGLVRALLVHSQQQATLNLSNNHLLRLKIYFLTLSSADPDNCCHKTSSPMFIVTLWNCSNNVTSNLSNLVTIFGGYFKNLSFKVTLIFHLSVGLGNDACGKSSMGCLMLSGGKFKIFSVLLLQQGMSDFSVLWFLTLGNRPMGRHISRTCLRCDRVGLQNLRSRGRCRPHS